MYKRKNILSNLLVAAIVFSLSGVPVLADTIDTYKLRDTYKLPKLNSGREEKVAQTRSGSNSNVSVRCFAVYPIAEGIEDTFTKMRVRIRNQSHLQSMSREKIISETDGVVPIDIDNNYLKDKDIYFCLYGNSENYEAYADVSMNAK